MMENEEGENKQAHQLPGPNLLQFPHVNWEKVLPDRWRNWKKQRKPHGTYTAELQSPGIF